MPKCLAAAVDQYCLFVHYTFNSLQQGTQECSVSPLKIKNLNKLQLQQQSLTTGNNISLSSKAGPMCHTVKTPHEKVQTSIGEKNQHENKPLIVQRTHRNVKPLRDRNEPCMQPPHHRLAFADNSRNKDLADVQNGLWLSFSITTWQPSNPTVAQLSPTSQGSLNMQGYSAQEDVHRSCGKQL